ncbi:hypothetical protein VC83_00620 [Pseudogymnoascus destructans]|uniref:Uncharacterized protein n=1 Tax=Pseudogymnoascus destructans TaxID=655981 RepID=A0A177AMY2_9PEZI|nr:uncharacterized protein VC83_00620 [Pseudogymnoascus destructans]OAF62842.1 hypothetical protein VC83_00620 [Pseudogymnoascus destructans]
MPAPEVNQPKAQAMDVPSAQAIQEQPKPVGKMTVEEPVVAPVSLALSASTAAARRIDYVGMRRDGYPSDIPEVEV